MRRTGTAQGAQCFQGLRLHHALIRAAATSSCTHRRERSGLAALNDGMRISFETEPDKRGKGPKADRSQADLAAT